jgi:hypothetical protein
MQNKGGFYRTVPGLFVLGPIGSVENPFKDSSKTRELSCLVLWSTFFRQEKRRLGRSKATTYNGIPAPHGGQ